MRRKNEGFNFGYYKNQYLKAIDVSKCVGRLLTEMLSVHTHMVLDYYHYENTDKEVTEFCSLEFAMKWTLNVAYDNEMNEYDKYDSDFLKKTFINEVENY